MYLYFLFYPVLSRYNFFLKKKRALIIYLFILHQGPTQSLTIKLLVIYIKDASERIILVLPINTQIDALLSQDDNHH